MSQEHIDRYLAAAHAMQTGVKYEQESLGSDDGSPKHLRVGINTAMTDHSSLVRLLIAKGVLTWDEYEQAICEGMEAEKQRYEEVLSKKTGARITLV